MRPQERRKPFTIPRSLKNHRKKDPLTMMGKTQGIMIKLCNNPLRGKERLKRRANKKPMMN
jgi:hypothetical protein